MNIDEIFAIDKDASEDGKWFDLGPNASIKMRSLKSEKSRAVRVRLELPYKSLTRSGRDIPNEAAEEILTRQMTEAVIIDWKGLSNNEGPLGAYTPDAGYNLLTKNTEFRDQLAQMVFDTEAFKPEDREQSFENLKPT